jgi:isopentenyl phosphate kinase
VKNAPFPFTIITSSTSSLSADNAEFALHADKLLFVTDVEGIMDGENRLDTLTPQEIQARSAFRNHLSWKAER